MSSELDLRTRPRAERRERLFERLDDADVGESVAVVTDEDVAVTLHRYRIKRGHRLDWESEERDTETREIRVTKGDRFGEAEWPDFDVREMPPQRRHEVLLDTFDDLGPDEGFVLVNDHDPKPLYHELRSTRGEAFEWEYLSEESGEWRVRIVKTGTAEATADDAVTTFDVREIPKQERHPTIHHRYGTIPEGEAIEIVAPHEPRPLRREFRHRYGESFAWDVVEKEPGRCRVRITKEGAADGDSEETAEPSAVPEESLDVTRELDVRELPPAQRHEKIYDAYADLEPGEAFVLVNDHDPKPLYHQFDAEAGEEFRWEYRRKEPGEFEVSIGKAETGRTEDESPSTPF